MKNEEVFYSNSVDEIAEIKEILFKAEISFTIHLNVNSHPVFGTNLSKKMQNILYKYVITVAENDKDKALKILETFFDQYNTNENEKNFTELEESEETEKNSIKESLSEISVSLILLLIFQHYSRFFYNVNKKIKKRKIKVLLNLIGIIVFMIVSLSCILCVGTKEDNFLDGLFAFVIIFLFYEFILNIIDYIIEKQQMQLICYLISLGILILIFSSAFFVIHFIS